MAGFDGVFAPAPPCSRCDPLIVVMNFMKHMINPKAVSICHQRNRFLEGFFSLGPNWVGPCMPFNVVSSLHEDSCPPSVRN